MISKIKAFYDPMKELWMISGKILEKIKTLDLSTYPKTISSSSINEIVIEVSL